MRPPLLSRLTVIMRHLAVVLALSALTLPAAAASWPAHPVQVVCSRWEGSNTDRNLRLLLKYLEPRLHARFTVSNLKTGDDTGLGGFINADPDGYTLVEAETFGLDGNELMGTINFGHEAFAPVAVFGRSRGWILAVSAFSPWHTLDELIEAARKAPRKLSFGCTRNATSHLPARMIARDHGAIFDVREETGHPKARIEALLQGRVDVGYLPYSLAREAIEQKKVRVLATMTAERLPMLPEVPTAVEAGLPNLLTEATYVLLAPHDTAEEIITALNAAIRDVVEHDRNYAREIAAELAQSPFVLDVEQTREALRQQRDRVQSFATYLRDD